jgi:hypothetical protein
MISACARSRFKGARVGLWMIPLPQKFDNAFDLGGQRLDDHLARRLGRHVQGKEDALAKLVGTGRVRFGFGRGFAAASHIALDDVAFALFGPSIFAVIALASWALRLPAHRDFVPGGKRSWSLAHPYASR